jgi:hypothetical protein
MYTSKTITKPDGTKYVQCTWVTSIAQEWTDDQEAMQRAINEFGSSS